MTNLKDGNNKSISLQKAQTAWISESDGYFSHPYFWAGFVNIGELEVEESSNPTPYLWGLGLMILLGIVGFLVFRQIRD